MIFNIQQGVWGNERAGALGAFTTEQGAHGGQPYQNYFQALLGRGHLSRAQEALLAVSAHLLLCQLFLELTYSLEKRLFGGLVV